MVLVTKRQQLLVERQNRIWIFEFTRDVMGSVAGRDWKPRLGGTESGVGAVIPLHGSSFAIASLLFWPASLANRILHVFFALGIVVGHANLFAVVHDGAAAQGEIKARHELGDLVIMLAVTIAHIRSRIVMVADHEHGPSASPVHSGNLPPEFRSRQFVYHAKHQVHRHLQFVAVLAV